MSKLSFRARALDAGKPMPIYKAEELPDAQDIAAINRTVPQMPTGMEREEETEHHLQRALSAQQVYGTAERLVIPIPDIQEDHDRYTSMYTANGTYKQMKQYVHVQPFGMDHDNPDYDMDSEDESWLEKQAPKMEVSSLTFENMMDRLEKGSGQTVVTEKDARALLHEDDDLVIAVYDYWLNKRLRMQHALIPQCKLDKRDGSTTNNPYVAFRRRTEKMMTRKNRKNDEASYEKMLKLKRDLNKALTLLELLRKREKTKKEMLKLTVEVVEKRYQMEDWEGVHYKEALDKRNKTPAFSLPLAPQQYPWDHGVKDEPVAAYGRKPRQYRKRKHKGPHGAAAAAALPQYSTDVTPTSGGYSSAEESPSPPSSPQADTKDDDPDGQFAFRRKPGVFYLAPVLDGQGNWPWAGHEEGGLADPRYRYSLTSLSHPRPRCIGFARRRVGRGGRVVLDRACSEWDSELMDLDLTPAPEADPDEPRSASPQPNITDILDRLRRSRVPHFRPRQSVPAPAGRAHARVPSFTEESFAVHQEALVAQKRAHAQARHQRSSLDTSTNPSGVAPVNPQTNSNATLDSATAEFAASAVRDKSAVVLTAVTSQLHAVSTVTASDTTPSSSGASQMSFSNGPSTNHSSSLSSSPAVTVLQLNYPLSAAASHSPSVTSLVTAGSAAPAVTSLMTSPADSAAPAVASKALSVVNSHKLLKLATLPQLSHTNHTPTSDSCVEIVGKDAVVPMEVT